MNYKALLVIANLILCISTNAEIKRTGSFSELGNAGTAKLELVFNEIHGMTEEEFSKDETDWYKDKPVIIQKFYTNAEEALEPKCHLSLRNDIDYVIKVVVNYINFKGDYNCDVILLDKEKKELGRIIGISADGGTFGSKLNLIKDGAEHTGKKVGSLLKRYLK